MASLHPLYWEPYMENMFWGLSHTTHRQKSSIIILSIKYIVEAGDTKEGRKLPKQKDNTGIVTNMNIWALNKNGL